MALDYICFGVKATNCVLYEHRFAMLINMIMAVGINMLVVGINIFRVGINILVVGIDILRIGKIILVVSINMVVINLWWWE